MITTARIYDKRRRTTSESASQDVPIWALDRTLSYPVRQPGWGAAEDAGRGGQPREIPAAQPCADATIAQS